ncbi:uncharacterized protein LOC110684559 [Chenopodium quinoa]|uniref:uncharacterized protein LOC110684559 n=1 Tax=Chenopodium quinoa TaxID=63459 RepID=UPI000B76DD78|nr:uncharacterized protein LOC110684559 [Chenopodium quinoa]
MPANDLQVNDAQPSPSSSTNLMELSPRLLEVPTKCRLALVDEFSGNSVIVADGTTAPCPSGVIHHKKMNRDIYRVSVDHVYSDYSHLNLPEETDDGITKLGQVKGYFLGWPTDLVFFTDEVMTLAKKMDNELVQTKEKVDSCGPINSEHSTIKGKGITIPENIVESLGEQSVLCCIIIACMTSGSGDYDTTTIPLKAPLFYQEEDTQIYVTSDDVSELLRGAWANISLIHVYILYLIEEYISLFQKTKIKFLYP